MAVTLAGVVRGSALIARRPLLFVECEESDSAATKKALLKEADYAFYYAQRPNLLAVPAELDPVKPESPVRLGY